MAAISELQNEIAKLCRDYMEVTKSDSQSSIIIEIIEAICKAKSNGILNLVEALGPYLSNDEIARRKKGTQLLAELMHRFGKIAVSHLMIGYKQPHITQILLFAYKA